MPRNGSVVSETAVGRLRTDSLQGAEGLLQAVEQMRSCRPANSAEWRVVWCKSTRDRQKSPVGSADSACWLPSGCGWRRNIPIGQVLRSTQVLEPSNQVDRWNELLQTAGVRAAVTVGSDGRNARAVWVVASRRQDFYVIQSDIMRGLQILTAFLCVCLISCQAVTARADQIPWQTDVEAALREASQSGQPVLMQFTASWCSYCKRMEKSTWTEPELVDRVSQDFVAVMVDADEHKELLQDLEIKGLPTVLVVSPKLEVIHRISGFQTAEAMQAHLDRAERQNAVRAVQSKTARSTPSAAAGRTPSAAAIAGRTPSAGSRTPPAAAAAKRAAPEMARTAKPPATKQPAAKSPATRSASRDAQVPVKSISRQGSKGSDEELPEFPVEPEDYSAARDRRTRSPAERESAEVVEPESFRDQSANGRGGAAPGAPSDTAAYPDDWSDSESPDFVHRSAPVKGPEVAGKVQRKAAGAADSPAANRSGTTMAQTLLQPAFGGNSLVSARDARAVVAGSSRHQLKWKGQLLYFATAEELEMFSANPQRYWPMLDGDCALRLLQSNRRVQGDLEHAALFRGRVWVFSTAEELREFVAAPSDVADEVQALLEQ